MTNTISNGIISNPSQEGYIQITAPISHGSSGGALLNVYGEVIGITTASITSGQNINFAVPINDVMPDEDITEYEANHGMLTMEDFARINGYMDDVGNGSQGGDYPEPGESMVREAEPNDTLKNADHVSNGDTVVGYIDQDDFDIFTVNCDKKGVISIILVAVDSDRYIEEVILAAGPSGEGVNEDTAFADYVVSDGTKAQYLEYEIPRAGEYAIYICMTSTYKTSYVDYAFYYWFE